MTDIGAASTRTEAEARRERVAHTPGPWVVFARNGVLEIDAVGPNAVVHWTGFDASAYANKPKENLANARLIASAPDLAAFISTVADYPLNGESGGRAWSVESIVMEARKMREKIG